LIPVPAFFSSTNVNLAVHNSHARTVPPFVHGSPECPFFGVRIQMLNFVSVLSGGVPAALKKRKEKNTSEAA
jgi:hypothetical protein